MRKPPLPIIVMLQNVPNWRTRAMFWSFLADRGFGKGFDLASLPMDPAAA